MSLKQIYIFRHGETDWNREGRFQGHEDIPINDTGRAQARSLITKLAEHEIDAILSSDLQRAYETARIVANGLGVPVFVDPGLKEAHLGEATGKLGHEIEHALGTSTVQRWKSNLVTDADVAYPGGETGTQILARVFLALEGFLHDRAFGRVGIATHGGVIRRFMQKVLPEGSEKVPIPNGVLYRLTYDLKTKRWKVDL